MVLCLPDSWSNSNLDMLVFRERETGVPGEKPLLVRETTCNNKVKPNMASLPGFQPGRLKEGITTEESTDGQARIR